MRWPALLLLAPLVAHPHEPLTGAQILSRMQAERVKAQPETVRYRCGYAGRYSDCWKRAVAEGLPITLSDLKGEPPPPPTKRDIENAAIIRNREAMINAVREMQAKGELVPIELTLQIDEMDKTIGREFGR